MPASCFIRTWRILVVSAFIANAMGVHGAFAQTSVPSKQAWINKANATIRADEMVVAIVGIQKGHPRFGAFEMGFERMFSSRPLLGAMYDALQENSLLDANPGMVQRYIQQWIASVGRRGMLRLDTDDLEVMLLARLGYFESIPPSECGKMLKADAIDNKGFYRWLARRASDRPVLDFLRVVTEALEREIQDRNTKEVITERQMELSGELIFERLAKSKGKQKAIAITQAVTAPKSAVDTELCEAAKAFWIAALQSKGETRRWAIRGIFTP